MLDITELKTGLPENLVDEKPLLEQYIVNTRQGRQSGTILFADGSLYNTSGSENTGIVSEKDHTEWVYFTKVESEGIRKIETSIRNEFFRLEQENMMSSTAQNTLIWKANLGGRSFSVKTASGLYSGLPPVFKKIDGLINQYMVRMNGQK